MREVEPRFLDTNILIRYLTKDDADQAERAYHLLRQVEAGTVAVTTTEGVLVEAVQILSSKRLYNLPRSTVRTQLVDILALRGLEIPHKRTMIRALDLFAATTLDFVDVLIVAHMERRGLSIVISFDRGFDRVVGITRQEP